MTVSEFTRLASIIGKAEPELVRNYEVDRFIERMLALIRAEEARPVPPARPPLAPCDCDKL